MAIVALAAFGVVGIVAYRHYVRPASPPEAGSAVTDLSAPTQPAISRLAAVPAAEPAPEEPHISLASRLSKGEGPRPVRLEQLDGYLRDNHRSVESLLGAYRTTRDPSLLRELIEKHPNDPRVNFDAVFFGPSEERRKWLEAFKQSAPDNALAYYLSAQDHFKAGQRDEAVQDVLQASARPGYQDYSADFMQNAEEAYRAAGFSEAEAKTEAASSLLLPQLAQLKQAGLSLVDLAKVYRESGDESSAQAELQRALQLGQRLNDPASLTMIQALVGIAIQRAALASLDPNSPYGDTGQTVQNQVDALRQEREAAKLLSDQVTAVAPSLSDQDMITYRDRQRLFGYSAAMQWLLDKYQTTRPLTTDH